MERATQILIEALKQALAEPGEQRLYRSGKLPGLFSSRAGGNAEAAQFALRTGLLELVRTEIRGKIESEWVRLTPRGVEFLSEHESPLAALHELRELLRATQQGLPAWVAQVHQTLLRLNGEVLSELQAQAHKLEVLQRRVEEAIRRVEHSLPRLPEDTARLIPWASSALEYLDRRQSNGNAAACPLSELFQAVQSNHAELTVTDYHAGLRRLLDRGVVRLLPWEGINGLPEPEFALLDGPQTYYYVQR